jgi:protein TonB
MNDGIRYRGTERRRRDRRPRPAAGLDGAFRRGLGISLALHALVVALFVADFFRPPTAEPGPRFFKARMEASVTLEEEPPAPPAEPPRVPPEPRGGETLLDAVEAEPDLRLDETPAPAGELPGTIGVLTLEGSRRPPSARPRGVPGGSGTGSGLPGEGTGGAPAPEPKREPVFVAAKRVADRCPVPAYPRREREKGIEGRVRLRLLVDAEGNVKEAAVARSSGSEALDEAALAAAKEWHFEPATEDGTPVASVVLQPLDFRIDDAGR